MAILGPLRCFFIGPIPTRRPATLLHTSDVHLGSARFDPDSLGREERAFAAAIALAIRARVDAVVIAGDLFDNARVSDALFDWTAAQIDQLECAVVVVPGNHDVHDETSVLRRFDLTARCKHAWFIDDHEGRVVEVPGTDIVVWGRAMAEHDPGYLPFAGLPPPPPDRWTVAVGHGLLHDDGPAHRSSPIFVSDLAAVRWDYVALGHVHVYDEVRDDPTPVRYSGATASSRDHKAGVVLVDFIPERGALPVWRELDVTP
jgi:DNA repair exonuclease SbcCD nuclease subunit